ncbi:MULTISPECIES: DUF4145 domain-containing protein [Bacillus cereus group]|uniref:DUF4145 domain-containing protein n=1 Tax=Bacillus cereus group TaxID=86661 RepID=UPI000BFB884E|nr:MULTISPECIES: DUF4145 domain-containing protein [Bacillus cereus group]PHD95396.1 hypothetical protein COF55_00150 [Bacillus toyonensis]
MKIGEIVFLSPNGDFDGSMNALIYRPQTCPICNYSILPTYILIYLKDGLNREVLCKCPRRDCASMFFANYTYGENPMRDPFRTPFDDDDEYAYVLNNLYPKNKAIKSFPKEITELSSAFVEIYNQAYIAEQEELNLICGVGYRKSLEFLIKDFANQLNPADTEKIKKDTLMNCIKKYIDHPKIKSMAERAVWLGNDETHYEKKWIEKDIQDLKTLIRLTVGHIELHLVSEKYELEMESGRK